MAVRRRITPFNLAFLDIMFCGFGAVVLLVLIVQAKTVAERTAQVAEHAAEKDRLARTVAIEQQHLHDLTAAVQRTELELSTTAESTAAIRRRIIAAEAKLADQAEKTGERRRQLDRAQLSLQELASQRQQVTVQERAVDTGDRARRFVGEGNRQYLTGLRLGGRRIALLVDVSASMLDTTVVNILRRRNMSPEIQRSAPKWRQTVATVEWLLANMNASAQVQIITFNNSALTLADSSWVAVNDHAAVDSMVAKLRRMLPAEGTDLSKAFTTLATLRPQADNCILLTDGLPTQGGGRAQAGAVSGKQRVRHFHQARQRLPQGLPVNTILFPMEGDPLASKLLWQLAVETKGSFMTPTRDWP